jgi:hypothetical protein
MDIENTVYKGMSIETIKVIVQKISTVSTFIASWSIWMKKKIKKKYQKHTNPWPNP